MNWGRAFFGALILTVGALLLLDNLDVLRAGEVIDRWWPVAIIAGGVLAFVANPRHWLFPVLLVAGGAVVLLYTTDVVDTLGLLLPAVLMLVGLLVIFGRGIGSSTTMSGAKVNGFYLFSGSKLASDSSSFEGGRVGAMFGGSEIDLRNASPAPDATLDLFAVFGGFEVAVPDGWRVDIHGLPIFGGWENITAKETLPADAPRLRIDATVLFGGLEVRH